MWDTSPKKTVLVAFASRPSVSTSNVNYTAENSLVVGCRLIFTRNSYSDILPNDEGFHLVMLAVLPVIFAHAVARFVRADIPRSEATVAVLVGGNIGPSEIES